MATLRSPSVVALSIAQRIRGRRFQGVVLGSLQGNRSRSICRLAPRILDDCRLQHRRLGPYTEEPTIIRKSVPLIRSLCRSSSGTCWTILAFFTSRSAK